MTVTELKELLEELELEGKGDAECENWEELVVDEVCIYD